MAETPIEEMLQEPAFLACQERLREQSVTFAACVSEGFCGTCRSRLEAPLLADRDGYCLACDVAWRVGPREEHGGHSWSRESGWYYRERAAAKTSGRYES